MTDNWVVDATVSDEQPWAFCPIEDDGTVVVGLTFVGGPPLGGKLIGVVHADGRDAVEAWAVDHKAELDELFSTQGET